jgi:hypothetical protein
MRFKEISACGMRRPHKCKGKALSTLQRPAIKCFWNVRMARFGGVASVNSRGNKLEIDFFFGHKLFEGSEHSLSRRCNRGWRPAWHSHACRVLYAVRMQAAVRLRKGSAKI